MCSSDGRGGGGRSSESGGGGGNSHSGGGEGKSELDWRYWPCFPWRARGRLAKLILPGFCGARATAEESLEGDPVVEDGVEKELGGA